MQRFPRDTLGAVYLDIAVGSRSAVVQFEPNRPAAHWARGRGLSELGCLEEAIVSFDRAVEMAQGNARVESESSGILERLGSSEAVAMTLRMARQLELEKKLEARSGKIAVDRD